MSDDCTLTRSEEVLLLSVLRKRIKRLSSKGKLNARDEVIDVHDKLTRKFAAEASSKKPATTPVEEINVACCLHPILPDEYKHGVLADTRGIPICLTAKEMCAIYSLFSSEVGRLKARGLLDEAETEIEVLTKIGPNGARLIPFLRKLTDDDQAVCPAVGMPKQ